MRFAENGVLCPICKKRKAVRHCPAQGEKICAVCCGTEREVSMDCPVDCVHLVTAHRYEDEHPRELPAGTPLLEVALPSDLIHIHHQFTTTLAFTVAQFCAANSVATDSQVLDALESLAATYKTLSSGIYYERPPALPLARELYEALNKGIREVREQAERASVPGPNDSEIFLLLVFLYRMGILRTNGRPRSRRFIEFLRRPFHNIQERKREESRIIVP